jgi:hypothetical protein
LESSLFSFEPRQLGSIWRQSDGSKLSARAACQRFLFLRTQQPAMNSVNVNVRIWFDARSIAGLKIALQSLLDQHPDTEETRKSIARLASRIKTQENLLREGKSRPASGGSGCSLAATSCDS